MPRILQWGRKLQVCPGEEMMTALFELEVAGKVVHCPIGKHTRAMRAAEHMGRPARNRHVRRQGFSRARGGT